MKVLALVAEAGLYLIGSAAVVYLVALIDAHTTSVGPKVLNFEDHRRRRASRLIA